MSKNSKAVTAIPASPAINIGINIGISEKDRSAIAGGLARLLADTYTLYLTTHNFHWNVTGPMFDTQRLAALVPRPRLHLIRFHGVLAP